MADSTCEAFDLGCAAGEVISGLANDAVSAFVKSLVEGTISTLKFLNTFWLSVPTPDVASTTVVSIQQNLAWYTYGFAVLGILLAVGKMLVAGDFKAGAPGARMIFNLILVTGVYTTGITLLLSAGDAFAPWIIERATGKELDLSNLIGMSAFNALGPGPSFLLIILTFLGAIANVVFMLIRSVMILILATFLPVLAASSASESGGQSWKKANGYLIAFLLFKPVAAVVIALGLTQLTPDLDMADPVGSALSSVSIGMVTLFMVALALPALVKFIVPVAANGSSMAFSGGAVAAGAVAAGAAIVTMGGSGAAMGAGAAGSKVGAASISSSAGGGMAGGSTAAAGSSGTGSAGVRGATGTGGGSSAGGSAAGGASSAGSGVAAASGSSSSRGKGGGTAVMDGVSTGVKAASGSISDTAEEN